MLKYNKKTKIIPRSKETFSHFRLEYTLRGNFCQVSTVMALATVFPTMLQNNHRIFNESHETRSVWKDVLYERFRRFILIHVFNPFYYFDIIQNNHVYFGTSAPIDDIVIRKPFIHVTFQGLICTFMALRCIFVIFSPPHVNRWTGNMLLPSNESKKFELTMVFWSLSSMLYIFWVIPNKLTKFKFMAPMAMMPDNPIRPESMGLMYRQYVRFDRFRNRALKLYFITTFFITSGAVIAPTIRYYLIFDQWVLSQKIIHLFVIFLVLIWVIYVDLGYYGLPALMMTVCYYLILKFSFIKVQLKYVLITLTQANHKTMIRRFYSILNAQAFIMREIQNYSFSIRRGLTAIFSIYIALMTYTTYLVLFTVTPPEFLLLFAFISIAQIVFLGGIIALCSKLASHNFELSQNSLRFYNILTIQKNTINTKEQLKYHTMIESLADYSSGFRLINSMLIDSKSYYVVVHNISLFFFLVFKR